MGIHVCSKLKGVTCHIYIHVCTYVREREEGERERERELERKCRFLQGVVHIPLPLGESPFVSISSTAQSSAL